MLVEKCNWHDKKKINLIGLKDYIHSFLKFENQKVLKFQDEFQFYLKFRH